MWYCLTHCHTLSIQKQAKNMHKYSITSKAGHFCPQGCHSGKTQVRWACPQCAFTNRDHWSLYGVDLLYNWTLLANSPLSNRLIMLVSGFYLCGLFRPTPHLQPGNLLLTCMPVIKYQKHLIFTVNIVGDHKLTSKFTIHIKHAFKKYQPGNFLLTCMPESITNV